MKTLVKIYIRGGDLNTLFIEFTHPKNIALISNLKQSKINVQNTRVKGSMYN